MRASHKHVGVGAIAAAAVTLFGAHAAYAADTSVLLGTRHKSFESPQHFALEFRFAPYTPQIDNDPALNGTPYRDTFGTMKRLLVAVELDWQLLRIPHVGTVGPGVSIGYTSMSDQAQRLPPRSGPSGDTTSLDVFPMYGVAVFRADVLMRDLRVPLVPYGKLGVGYALWRSYTTGGTSQYEAPSGTVNGKGQTWGYHVAGGVAFQLDVLDPGAAKNLDNTIGINHTYLFAEWMYSALNGIGQQNALRVGTSTWAAGLAFEF